MRLTFHIWRQPNGGAAGRMERYESSNMNPDMSMLEALDVLNEELIAKGTDPVVFEHDCREGICGSCETKVLEGLPDHRDSVLTDKQRKANRTMMPCVSGCKSERLILDL